MQIFHKKFWYRQIAFSIDHFEEGEQSPCLFDAQSVFGFRWWRIGDIFWAKFW